MRVREKAKAVEQTEVEHLSTPHQATFTISHAEPGGIASGLSGNYPTSHSSASTSRGPGAIEILVPIYQSHSPGTHCAQLLKPRLAQQILRCNPCR